MLAWEQFLSQIELEYGAETVLRWLRTLKIVRYDACNLYLEAQDSFQVMWFDEHIRPKLAKFVNNNQKLILVHLLLPEPAPTQPRKRETGKRKAAPDKTSDAQFQIFFEELDTSCSLDDFVVSDDNHVAFSVLDELCKGRVTSQVTAMSSFSPPAPTKARDFLNPIYLYGPSGSGKTHLMMAVAQKLRRVGYKAVYARSELFTEHVVKAIRMGEMSHFRKTYRNADVLLIDDIQVFGRKNATQEEFFHTFNALHTDGKQIILSANVAPQALQFVEARLISRFEWGIVLPLAPSQKRDIAKILERKAIARNFAISARNIEFLVDIFATNPKSAVRALDACILRSHVQKVKLTHNAMQSLLADLIEQEKAKAITTSRIIEKVAEHFALPTEDILSKSQTREYVLPRQLAMYLCRQLLNVPYMRIGDLFQRDHSTVMSACRQIEKQLKAPGNDLYAAASSIKQKLS